MTSLQNWLGLILASLAVLVGLFLFRNKRSEGILSLTDLRLYRT